MNLYKLSSADHPYTAAPAPRGVPSFRPRLVHARQAHPPAPMPCHLPAQDGFTRLAAQFIDPQGQAQTLSLTSTWHAGADNPQQGFQALATFLSQQGCTLVEVQQTTHVGIEL